MEAGQEGRLATESAHRDAGRPVAELLRKHEISSATYYAWKAKYGEDPSCSPLASGGAEQVSGSRVQRQDRLHGVVTALRRAPCLWIAWIAFLLISVRRRSTNTITFRFALRERMPTTRRLRLFP